MHICVFPSLQQLSLQNHIKKCFFNASTHTHTRKQNFTSQKNQTIDGVVLNKPDRNHLPSTSTSTSDATDGAEHMPAENQEMFSSTELNQVEISSDDEGAARSRPLRTVAKKRKAKGPKGRKQQAEEMADVFID